MAAPLVGIIRWESCRNILSLILLIQILSLLYLATFAIHQLDVQDPPFYIRQDRTIASGPLKIKTDRQEFQYLNHPNVSKITPISRINELVTKESTNIAPLCNVKVWENSLCLNRLDVPGAYYLNFELKRELPNVKSLVPLVDQEFNIERHELWSKNSGKYNTKSNQILQQCYHYDKGRIMLRSECSPNDGIHPVLVVYNSLPSIHRYWCGEVIPPLSFRNMPEWCNESVKLTTLESFPVSGLGMPPIQVIRSGDTASLQKLQNCNINCELSFIDCSQETTDVQFWGEKIGCLPPTSEWTIGGTDWKLSINHNVLGIPAVRKSRRNFKFFSSHSFSSDIPLTSFRWDREGGSPSPANHYDNAENSISFLDSTSDCSQSKRVVNWIEALRTKVSVSVYDKCNTTISLDLQSNEGRKKLYRKHLFALIVDESMEKDYITNSLWEALYAGVIPIYYGAKNIDQYVPPNSLVTFLKIGKEAEAVDKVYQIMQNSSLWEIYHEWRNGPLPSVWKPKFEFAKTEPFCRICRWAYVKRYGLGLNQHTYHVQAPLIPRDKICVSKDGLAVQPFQESWILSSNKFNTVTTSSILDCVEGATLNHQTIGSDDSFRVTRTLSLHDSMVDILFHSVNVNSGDLVLRLEVPILNREGAYFRNVHETMTSHRASWFSSIAIQDRMSRMTILCNWPTKVFSPDAGKIDIQIQGWKHDLDINSFQEARMVRIILEDLTSNKDVMTEYAPTPFAKPLMEDFIEPLDLYFIQS
jgi:Glycosyltransferase family 10 (fucosyltransferase) C-term